MQLFRDVFMLTLYKGFVTQLSEGALVRPKCCARCC